MTAAPEPPFGIVQLGPFAGFVHRFDDLIASATTMALYFIHSRRWRENHDAAIKGFLGRPGTTLEAFLPDLESHELIFSLGKHFEDGPLIPALVADAYRYFARLARDFGQPAHVWLFDRYPTYSLLSVRRPRGDRPVFQHVRQEGAAGVRAHHGWLSGKVPRGG